MTALEAIRDLIDRRCSSKDSRRDLPSGAALNTLLPFFQSAASGSFRMKAPLTHDPNAWVKALDGAISRPAKSVLFVDIDYQLADFSPDEVKMLGRRHLPGVTLWERLVERHRTVLSERLQLRHGSDFEHEFDKVLSENLARPLESAVKGRFSGGPWYPFIVRIEDNLWHLIRLVLAAALAGDKWRYEKLAELAQLMTTGIPLCERVPESPEWIILCG
jgi:hypothetical protein